MRRAEKKTKSDPSGSPTRSTWSETQNWGASRPKRSSSSPCETARTGDEAWQLGSSYGCVHGAAASPVGRCHRPLASARPPAPGAARLVCPGGRVDSGFRGASCESKAEASRGGLGRVAGWTGCEGDPAFVGGRSSPLDARGAPSRVGRHARGRHCEALDARGAAPEDVRLFITFLAAMDRARDADRLWFAGADFFVAAPWVSRREEIVHHRICT
jgi:hypothetical protein